MKLITLVSVWTMVTAVVPMLLNGSDFSTNESWLHISVRFIFLTAICIPFDIRDIRIDKADTISTLPRLLGEKKTRNVATVCSLIYILLLVAEYLTGMFNAAIFGGLMISAVITGIFVAMSHSKRTEYFYVAGLDGTMILQGFLVLIASQF